jgi:hAT family C-terminal dimerisation region
MQQRTSNSFKYQMLVEKRTTIFNFWDCYKQDWPMLAHLALKMFSLAPSSAASERNFSCMAFIHSKLRNCLSPETVEKLVYIKTNNLQFSTNSDLAVYNELGDESDTEGEVAG